MKKLVLGLLFFGVSCGTPVDPLNASSDCEFDRLESGWTVTVCEGRKSLLSYWTNSKGERQERMSFDEDEYQAQIGFNCRNNRWPVGILFNKVPSLEGHTSDGRYNRIRLRVIVDGLAYNGVFLQSWGLAALIPRDAEFGRILLNSDLVVVEVPWYREGTMKFKIKTAGVKELYDTRCGQ